jgi:histidyl-tRNA synthetase
MPKIKKNKDTIQSPKGMHDILPKDQPLWEKIRKSARDLASYYNYQRIDTPILEKAELFERSVGLDTDIIEKEMFILKTKGRDKLALRPEATAPIARAFIQNGLSQLGLPLKLYHEGSLFRYEQPQAGRVREFRNIDFEIISNENDPIYDTQVILVLYRFLESAKIKNLCININSIGCKECRPAYKKKIQSYYKTHKNQICKDCVIRLGSNPLRLLDCKQEKCQEFKDDAPIILDNICAICKNHFKKVLEYLDELELPYNLNHQLVRGLDYYTKTVFEIYTEGIDLAIGGGGRYDYLIEQLGGKKSPAVGWGLGIERVIEVIKQQEINLSVRLKKKIFLIYIGELAKKRSLVLIETLRKSNIDVTESLGKESLQAQLRSADKMKAPIALIFGQKEAFEQSVIMRDMKSGVQETVMLDKLPETIKKKKIKM